jgi:hypothetical protein
VQDADGKQRRRIGNEAIQEGAQAHGEGGNHQQGLAVPSVRTTLDAFENARVMAPAIATVVPMEQAYLVIVVETIEKLTDTTRLISENITYCLFSSFSGLFSSIVILSNPYPLMEPIMMPFTKYFCKNG